MLKNYQTIEAKWSMVSKIVTNRIKAEFSQNRQKAQNITKPTEAKPLTHFNKLQNERYLETQNYKTNQLQNKNFLKTIFTIRFEANSFNEIAAPFIRPRSTSMARNDISGGVGYL
jgi:hypothetical protein